MNSKHLIPTFAVDVATSFNTFVFYIFGFPYISENITHFRIYLLDDSTFSFSTSEVSVTNQAKTEN